MKSLLFKILPVVLLGLSAVAGAPPKEVGQSVFRLSDLKPVYHAGTATNEAFLTGKWKLIAAATSAACAKLQPDVYDPNGIKNPDGSLRELDFLLVKKLVLPGSRKPVTGDFAVKLNNLGISGGNQGPYEVDPNEPQFAQWPFLNATPELNKIAYYSYSCRSADNKDDTLICAVKFVLVDSKGLPPELVNCANENEFSFILVYTRQ